VAAAETASESPVFPGSIEVIVRIFTAGIVADPPATFVDVRSRRRSTLDGPTTDR
jgi:hypothetical protein